ncbi:MAG: ATP-binding protein [bacterium]|nr:ATP-binding protein [bacterium]
MGLIARHLRPRLERALERSRVVMLHGARQCGKTTLARMVAEDRGGAYVSLDDEVHRQAVLDDPIDYLSHFEQPLVIDEIQLGGDRVVRAIKQLVDESPALGRFLITGSTNFLTVPTISESLAGRVRILRLGPLSQAELSGSWPTAVSGWFEGEPGPIPASLLTKTDYLALVSRGGYPEVIDADPEDRRDWFGDYIETVVQRDIAALADIRKTASLPLLLRWTAALTSHQINLTDAARDLRVSPPTIVSYLEWLRTVFLIHELPAWSRSLWPKAGRRPKFHITDSGLAATLLGADADAMASPTHPATGPLLETFTVNEVARQLAALPTRCTLSHYRDRQGREIDLILEASDGGLAAVEVKATTSPALEHLDNLRWLRDRLDGIDPGAFRTGILLHTGAHAATLDDRLHLRPLNTLWSG